MPEPPTQKTPFERFVSADVVRKRLTDDPDGFYLGDKSTALKSSHFHLRGGAEGNVLVVDDDTGAPTEMILRGVFRIDPRNFYLTADAGFDPAKNMFNTPFSKIKANCHLTPILGEPDFSFSIADYDTICETIRALQSKAPGNKNDEVLSVLHRLSGSGEKGGGGNQPFMSIKLSHYLFMKKGDDNEEEAGDDCAVLADWPVADRCTNALQRLVADGTHNVNPILAYDVNNKLIAPKNYTAQLSGAVAEVHFALVHHHLESKKRSTFTASLRELHVLCPPAQVSNPLKKKRKQPSSTSESGGDCPKKVLVVPSTVT